MQASQKRPKKIIKIPSLKKDKKKLWRYHIDCKLPVEDGILDVNDFEKYLRSRVKAVKRGKLNDYQKTLSFDRAAKNQVGVTSSIPFSKRYLKYLSKKYLKKNNLRDWLRVVSNAKDSYELIYFQSNAPDDAAA